MASEISTESKETAPFVGERHKVSSNISQNEGLIFEKSSPGKRAYRLAPLDVPPVDAKALLGETAREDLGPAAGGERD